MRALEASQNADSMSMGIKEKSGAALAKTQELNDKANDAENTVDNELQPQLDTSKAQVEDLGTKNKVTKQHVEGIIKKLDEMKDLGDETRAAVENATSTSKVAEDALASIDARFANKSGLFLDAFLAPRCPKSTDVLSFHLEFRVLTYF